MSQFTTQCPHCQQQFAAQTEWIGQQAACPACGKLFTITQSTAAPVPNLSNTDFTAQCPFCQQQFNVQTEWLGLQTVCPNCQNNFIIENTRKQLNFLQIIKHSKTLLPELILFVLFLVFFLIYVYGMLKGISEFNSNERVPKPFGFIDLLSFNVPYPQGEIFPGLRLGIFLDNFLWFVVWGGSVLFFVYAWFDETIFRKIKIFGALKCLAIVLLAFVPYIIDLSGMDRIYDLYRVKFWFSTLFYAFILILCSIAATIWLKYQLYIRECTNGEPADFVEFVKKHSRWDVF